MIILVRNIMMKGLSGWLQRLFCVIEDLATFLFLDLSGVGKGGLHCPKAKKIDMTDVCFEQL